MSCHLPQRCPWGSGSQAPRGPHLSSPAQASAGIEAVTAMERLGAPWVPFAQPGQAGRGERATSVAEPDGLGEG
jgi:hypothetical protein